MATITDISTQKKRDTRASVYLDGRFYCGLEKITIIKADLKIGQQVDAQYLQDLQVDSELMTAFDKAVKHLSSRMRTQKQIEKYLLQKGYLQAVVSGVIDKLLEYKYIDDQQYCLSYISAYRRKLGIKRIQMELKNAGVDKFVICDALQDFGEQIDEAVIVVEKYLRSHEYQPNKVYNFLYAKGFDYDTIKGAIRQVENNIQDKLDSDFKEDNQDE